MAGKIGVEAQGGAALADVEDDAAEGGEVVWVELGLVWFGLGSGWVLELHNGQEEELEIGEHESKRPATGSREGRVRSLRVGVLGERGHVEVKVAAGQHGAAAIGLADCRRLGVVAGGGGRRRRRAGRGAGGEEGEGAGAATLVVFAVVGVAQAVAYWLMGGWM